MMEEQLLLFQDPPEEVMKRKMDRFIETCEKRVKGQFGKIGLLEKRVKDLECKLDLLESFICKTGLF